MLKDQFPVPVLSASSRHGGCTVMEPPLPLSYPLPPFRLALLFESVVVPGPVAVQVNGRRPYARHQAIHLSLSCLPTLILLPKLEPLPHLTIRF
jgi:hypothetical protein